ncbi:MAG: IS4 family transposase [Syntrophobacteraceae bacterium]
MRVARKTGFLRRCRKINPAQLLQALVMASSQAAFSFRLIALFFGLLSNQRISKQAIAKRINAKCVQFMRSAVFAFISNMSKFDKLRDDKLFEPFCRVLIQDSTVVSLPVHLASYFPGPANHTRRKLAALRIQTYYDLRGENFPYFEVSGFRRIDQAAAGDILSIATPGDLVLRDMGYFKIPILKNLLDCGIHFLSRLPYKVSILDPTTLKPIDLLSELKRKGRFDQTVLIGAEHRFSVRLIALPLPEQVVNERRRKAKKNRDTSRNPSKRHLEMLAWNIFVTSVSDSIWSCEDVEKVYRVRWRIELIFKSWKSHFHLTATPTGSVYELETFIWAKLLHICLFQNMLGALDLYYSKYRDTQASLLKTAPLFNCLLTSLLGRICPVQISIEIIEQHLRVEKKKKPQYPETIILLS